MDKIRVEMKCNDRFFNAGMAATVIILAIWFAVMLTYFSVVSLVLFLICTGLFVGIVIAFEKIPTVAEADGNELNGSTARLENDQICGYSDDQLRTGGAARSILQHAMYETAYNHWRRRM